jgi:hypothetical protein
VWIRSLILVTLFGSLSGSSVNATSFYLQPFSESVESSQVIVRGKVGSKTTDWNEDQLGTKRIYTFYELQTSEVFKGNVSKGSTITLRELGGEKDGIGLVIPGVSEFEKGEDTVVLLKNKNSSGTYDVQGMMMGKFGIKPDGDGTETLVGMGVGNEKKWSLNALRELIKEQKNPVSYPISNVPQAKLPVPGSTSVRSMLEIPGKDSSLKPGAVDISQEASNSTNTQNDFRIWKAIALGILSLILALAYREYTKKS